MMIPNQMYEFVPPNGDPARPIKILGLQEYSPGQTRKADVWKLELPTEYAAPFGGHVEFSSYAAAMKALANQFCNGDEAIASAGITTKFSDREY